MESNSKSNRILCSAKAHKLLLEQAPEIVCQKRGKIQVKGKGDMMTYWVGDNLIKARRDVREEGKTIAFADYVVSLSSPQRPINSSRYDFTGAIIQNKKSTGEERGEEKKDDTFLLSPLALQEHVAPPILLTPRQETSAL